MIKPRGKTHLTYTLSEIYEIYKQDRQDWPHLPDRRKWLKVAKKLLYELSLLIIRENLLFKIPVRMGKIGIKKSKNHSKFRIDWAKTKEVGKVMYHLNHHTDRYYFRWYWSRKSAMFTNKYFYSFKPIDDKARRKIGKRGLAAWIKKLGNDPYKKDYDCLEFWS